MSLLSIGVSGLNAAQAGILTTEHNIANANTDGYRRQTVSYTPSTATYTGAGYLGTGVSIDAVRSQYSQFLDSEVLLNQTQLSSSQAYADQASQVDALLGNSDSGLSSALDSFFAAANAVANDPTSGAARQVLLSAGNNLAGRINTLYGKLSDYQTSSNKDITGLTTSVNTLAGQIAALNDNIARSEALNGKTANDLRDQRDNLLSQLNQLVNVSTVEQGDGSFSVFIGSGQALVSGTKAFSMGTTTDPNNSALLVPTLNLSGTSITLDASLISGGKLGGILAQRQQVLQPAMDDLNRIALAVGISVNQVQGAGLDYSLNPGAAFFTDPVVGAAGNTGSLSIALGNDLQLTNANYSLSFDGTNYTLTSNAVTIATDPSLAALTSGLGFTLNADLAPVAGDSWNINLKDYARNMRMVLTDTGQVAAAAAGPTPGVGDNANALALAALQTSTIMNNGTATFANVYNQTVSRTATLASSADLNTTAFTSLLSQAKSAQGSVSGVNLDEEAANLIRFQQAYQASAKAIQVASSLFSDLLGVLS